ncbi:MAG: DUF5312 domain-containing protein [Treponema sp.]|jgi:hypothetical protein|nr:DUF5312 domain-containing protein [Treponema sp.]
MADIAENETFNRLAMEMSLEERNDLLKKLSGQSNISREPLYEDTEESEFIDSEAKFASLPWYSRLLFFILSSFKSISPLKMYETRQVAKLGREIEARAPGVFDQRHNLLLSPFQRALADLKEGARFFYTVLDSSFNRDRSAFYAFLASLEMEDIHNRLQTETNPNTIAAQKPGISEAELRQLANNAIEGAFAAITEEHRNAMYDNARSLYCLKELASFLFDRVLLTFTFEPSVSDQASLANVVKEQLVTLNNILFSFKKPPSMTLIESLFVFILQKYQDNPNLDMDMEIQSLLSKAEDSLVAIRVFNKQIPLTFILRCVYRNMSLAPTEIAGGEDWFAGLQEYWKAQVEAKIAEYMKKRRQEELFETFRYFLKGVSLKVLKNVGSESNPAGIPICGSFGLSFLLTFYSAIFIPDINKVLRPILLEGEFIKRENRTIFTESYNDLSKLEDAIKKFDEKLSAIGDFGKLYALANEETSLPVKRRKIQIITEDATDEAYTIVEQTRTAISSLLTILNAVLPVNSEEKSAILVNITKFVEKSNPNTITATGNSVASNTPQLTPKGLLFITSITDVIQKLQKTLEILDEIGSMESNVPNV